MTTTQRALAILGFIAFALATIYAESHAPPTPAVVLASAGANPAQ